MSHAAETTELTPARRAAILVSGMFTVTLYFTTILVVSTVLPQIQGAMSATPDEVSWIVTFNILAIAIATPMTGWLVARFGRRRTMCTCVAGFVFSTVMCGLAPSLETLVFWRVVQGAIGAPTVPLAQSILLDIYPKEQHRFVMGMNGMGVILGPIIGPTLAGQLAEDYGWRWAFHMLLPVSILAFLGLFLLLPRDQKTERIRFDWIGFLSLSITVGSLQYVLARGPRLDWLESQQLVIASVLGVLALYVFLAHSLTTEKPFLDLKLLANRNLALGFLLVTLFGMLAFTPMVVLPTLLRQHVGYPDALVGLVIGSRGVGGLIGFFVAMWIDRIDPRLSMATGFFLLAMSGLWLTFINLDVTPWELAVNGMVQGMCIGIVFVPLSIATFSDLEPRKRPEALGVFHLLRNLGSSLFISITIAGIVTSTGGNYARLIEQINPFNPMLSLPWVTGGWDASTPGGLARLAREVNRQASMIAYINAFGLFTIVASCAVPVAMLLKRALPAAAAASGQKPSAATAATAPAEPPKDEARSQTAHSRQAAAE